MLTGEDFHVAITNDPLPQAGTPDWDEHWTHEGVAIEALQAYARSASQGAAMMALQHSLGGASPNSALLDSIEAVCLASFTLGWRLRASQD
jgi:hypothetical protein